MRLSRRNFPGKSAEGSLTLPFVNHLFLSENLYSQDKSTQQKNISINITVDLITHTHGNYFNIESLKKIQKINLYLECKVASYFKTLEKKTACAVKPVKHFEDFQINLYKNINQQKYNN